MSPAIGLVVAVAAFLIACGGLIGGARAYMIALGARARTRELAAMRLEVRVGGRILLDASIEEVRLTGAVAAGEPAWEDPDFPGDLLNAQRFGIRTANDEPLELIVGGRRIL